MVTGKRPWMTKQVDYTSDVCQLLCLGGWDRPTHIKLYGGKGERFEEIKAQLAEELGYEPTNPEVMGILMAEYPTDTSDSPNDALVSEGLDD